MALEKSGGIGLSTMLCALTLSVPGETNHAYDNYLRDYY